MRRTRISLLLVLGMLAALLPMGAVAPAFAANDHLMLTELVVTPDEGEFIEIHNPTASAIDLSNYYLTDATYAGGNTYYYNIVTGTNAGGGSYGDFHAQFPVGASIAPGEYQTVSMAGSADFATAYGIAPTYELFEDDAIPDTVPDMREVVAGSINGQGGLSNSGEVAVLYTWEGASDLVTDIDYAVWGDKVEAVDKTGVAIDGPDGDADASAYLPDTAIGSQDVVATDAHQIGEAFRRADLNEGTETGAGGNGINGDDETSENTSVTWETAIPSPGAAEPAPPVPVLVVNEIIQDPSAVYDSAGEWFEIYNAGAAGVDIDGWTIKDDGSDSHVIANGGPLVVPAGGYLVLGNNADALSNGGVAVDYAYPSSWYLGNSDDEVVLLDAALVEVDRVEYDGGATFPDPTGASMALDAPANDNNDGANWCTASTPFGDGDLGTPGAANDCSAPPVEACGDPATPVHTVQGSGLVSPIVGQVVTVEAVVVGDFQEGNQLNGFFVQEEDADFDGDVSTSEGIFIDESSYNGPDVNAGDLVRATGTVVENFEHTEIVAGNVLVCDYAAGPYGPVNVTLPETTDGDLEMVEGMYIDLTNTMSVAQNYFVGRYGQLTLSSDLTNRLFQPTNQVLPNTSESAALADYNNRQLLFLDDGMDVSSCGDNPVPVPYLGAAPPSVLRGGDQVDGLTGVLDYGKVNSGSQCWVPASFNRDYRLHPTQAPVFSTQNPRTTTPDDVGGSLKLVSFNVLNFFNGDGVGGGFPTSRGADTFNEFVRQRIKIYEAMKAIDGDVVGLMEIENDGFDKHSAIAELVKVLNEGPCWDSPGECAALGYADPGLGAGTYAYIDAGPGAIGSDAIAVGFIYKPASVTPVGEPLVVDEAAFVDPNNTGSERNRPAIAQTFRANSDGALFTPIVNHLKSKGSPCGPGDDDPEQASCNVTRTLAAQYLVDTVVPAVQAASGDPDVAIIGDLNAYAMEDPVQALVSGGFTDLVKAFAGEYAYSYTFDGLVGYLDHSLASNNLVEQVAGVTAWHINTDEPAVIDYNEDFNPPGYYGPDQYRSSDHDPIVVGLNLTVTPKQAKAHSIGVLSELLPTGSWYYDFWIKKAIKSIEDSLNPAYWVDDFHLTDKGKKVFDKERWAVRALMWVHGSVESEVDAVILALVTADEELASIAIAEATAAGGSEWYLKRAEREMERAQYDWDRGRPDKAINHYKKAWEYAGRSLGSHWWHCGR